MRLAIGLATLLALAAPRAAHAGACARMGLSSAVLTHPADPLPVDGGVLVGWQPGNGDDDVASGDPSVHADWRFRVGKRAIKPTLTTIAPGLSVYAVGKRKGKLTLIDGKGKKRGAFTAGAKQPSTLAAPVLKSLTFDRLNGGRGGTYTTAGAVLDAAPPADALGVIVYDASGTVLTWANVTGVTTTTIDLYRSPGRCGQDPPGTQAPYQGQSVQLAWVDRFGRVSAKSAAATVPPPATPPSQVTGGP